MVDPLGERRERAFRLLVRQLWDLVIHGSYGEHMVRMRDGVVTVLRAEQTIPMDLKPEDFEKELDELPKAPNT